MVRNLRGRHQRPARGTIRLSVQVALRESQTRAVARSHQISKDGNSEPTDGPDAVASYQDVSAYDLIVGVLRPTRHECRRLWQVSR